MWVKMACAQPHTGAASSLGLGYSVVVSVKQIGCLLIRLVSVPSAGSPSTHHLRWQHGQDGTKTNRVEPPMSV